MKPFPTLAALAVLAGACADPATKLSAPVELSAPGALSSVLGAGDGTRVMSNLVSPRGLAWGPDGSLYVTEAGSGGPAAVGPCFVQFNATFCYGNTGGVSRLRDGEQERVISGLPSYAQVNSGQGEGPNGISFQGLGNAYVTIGLETDPLTLRARAPEWSNMGRLVQIEPAALAPGQGWHSRKSWEFVADLGQYEIDANPDCGDIDSNPFGVLADGDGVLVMDAGANSIVRRAANGELSTFAVFSNNSTVPGPGCPAVGTRDFVPTTITVGPDGAYYFSHLNGLPILAGSSSVWRMEPRGAPEQFLTGFTWVIAIAFDPSGNLYILQYSVGPLSNSGGSLVRVAPDGTRETVVSPIPRAGGLAVGPDGAVYVSMVQGQNYRAPGEVRRYVIP